MAPKRQILVVEDNWINRETLKEILSERYTVLDAENGRQALDILNQQKNAVTLILLDVMMPVMDGFTFLDTVKKDPELSLIPVIVTTQSDSEDDEVTALAHGATDFVPKPYRPQVILHRVASIINLRETAAMVNQFQNDQVTGLYSKQFFFHKSREILLENPEKEYSLVCSNIENFKLYNDAFGIPAGDRLLRQMATVARKMVGSTGICGCFRADRFVFLLEREKELRDRITVAAQINQNTEVNEHVVIKFGVYEITDRSVLVEQMCDRAFLAADSIKGQYHESVAVYDDTLRSKLLREQAITESMEKALKEGQFTVYFQPKYSLTNNGLAGAEALVRWIHPELGFLSPVEFIPLFEQNGFITRLDRYVWEQVCRTMQDWKRKGYPALPVSVNVSRADVYHSDLANTLLGMLNKYGLDPSQLHLELTESAYTENPGQIIGTVDQLRSLGFIVEMDDFGSGYSSLSMLNQMKFDILKLDMKFIQSETAKPTEQGVLQFIVSLARWMNLSVVAEGVETRAQLERLREIGCDYVQGYFFAKPMIAADFDELLRAQQGNTLAAPAEKPKADSGLYILVVDEDGSYRERIRQTFEGQYGILEASDAHGAIEHIREYGCRKIAVVILSMSLPEKGAEFFITEMRSDPMLWQIPILATMPLCEVSEDMAIDLDTDDFLCKRHPMRDMQRRVRRLIRLVNYQEQEQTLRNEASQDYLTGLLNRRGLYTALDSLRQEDLPAAMYFFDLDDLKRVNDQYGHETGDEMLRHFGGLLRSQTRKGDVLCRYGGDEFVVILRHISSEKTIVQKGEDICEKFREYLLPDGTPAACSCGIARCGGSEKPSAALIARADAALYRAKQEKKGGCCLWTEVGKG